MKKLIFLFAFLYTIQLQAQDPAKAAVTKLINDSIRVNGTRQITALTLNQVLQAMTALGMDSTQVLNTIAGQINISLPTLSGGTVPKSQLPSFIDSIWRRVGIDSLYFRFAKTGQIMSILDSLGSGGVGADSSISVILAPLSGVPMQKLTVGTTIFIIGDTSIGNPGAIVTRAGAQKRIDSIGLLLSAKFGLSDTGYTHLLASVFLLKKVSDSLSAVNIATYRTILDTTFAHFLMTRAWGYKISDSLAADYISRLAAKRDITDTSFAHLLMTRAWGYKISDSIFAVINAALAGKQASGNYVTYQGSALFLGGGLFSSRPAASTGAGFWYASDQQILYYSNGTSWAQATDPPGSNVKNIAGSSGISRGAYLSRPAAGSAANTFYWSTDSVFWSYSDGSSWKDLKSGSGGGGSGTDSIFQSLDTFRYRNNGVVQTAWYNPFQIGQMYSSTSFSSSDITTFGSPTVTFTGGKIQVSGGANNFANGFTLNSIDLTALESWEVTFKVQLTANSGTSTDAFSIGLHGPHWDAWAKFNQNTVNGGKVSIYLPLNSVNNTLLTTSSTAISYSTSDDVYVTFRRDKDRLTIRATDANAGQTTASSTFWTVNARDGNQGTLIGSGKFAFTSQGSTQTIDSIGISSSVPKYGQAILTDSKGQIVSDIGGMSGAWTHLLQRQYPNTAVLAGPSDDGVDAIARINDIVKWIKPLQAFVQIGRNGLATANANNDTINAILGRSNIRCIFVSPTFETTLSQTGLYTHLATYAPNFIDVYGPTIPVNANIHLPEVGHNIVAEVISNTGKMFGMQKQMAIGTPGALLYINDYGIPKSAGNFLINPSDTSMAIGNLHWGINSAGFIQYFVGTGTFAQNTSNYFLLVNNTGATTYLNAGTTVNLAVGTTVQAAITNGLFSITPKLQIGNAIQYADGFGGSWSGTGGAQTSYFGSNAAHTIVFRANPSLSSGAAGAFFTSNNNFAVGRLNAGFAVADNGRKFQDSGTAWINDTLLLPNIQRHLFDSTNYKPVVVDASGNTWKTDWAGILAWIGGGSGYSAIQNNGSSVTARTNINFPTGSGLTATDNSGNSSTDITVTALQTPSASGSCSGGTAVGSSSCSLSSVTNSSGNILLSTSTSGAGSTSGSVVVVTIPAQPTSTYKVVFSPFTAFAASLGQLWYQVNSTTQFTLWLPTGGAAINTAQTVDFSYIIVQ